MVGKTDYLCLLHHLFGNPTRIQVQYIIGLKLMQFVKNFVIGCWRAHEKNLKQQFKFQTVLFIYILQKKMRVKIFIMIHQINFVNTF
jgi:hypothetical protein